MSIEAPIFLAGFMASGKTTLGRALAAALPGYHFVDIDESVEAASGMTVSEIFDVLGEGEFRRLESEVLRATARPGAIIALGGGTPCRRSNMDFMLATGLTVLLEADDDITIERLRLARGQRPLVNAVIDNDAALRRCISRLRALRADDYNRCRERFDSSRLDTEEEVADSVALFIQRFITKPNPDGSTNTP